MSCVSGARSPPAIPCRTRAPTSTGIERAAPHAIDAAVKRVKQPM